jgi:hypothetical protein
MGVQNHFSVSAALSADGTAAVMPNVNNKNIKAKHHMLII